MASEKAEYELLTEFEVRFLIVNFSSRKSSEKVSAEIGIPNIDK